MQNSLQVLDNKPKLVRRKNDSAMKNNVKENTFKPQPQVHQNLLTSIRKQALSASKYPLQGVFQPNGNSYNTSEKLIPFSNFQSRRL